MRIALNHLIVFDNKKSISFARWTQNKIVIQNYSQISNKGTAFSNDEYYRYLLQTTAKELKAFCHLFSECMRHICLVLFQRIKAQGRIRNNDGSSCFDFTVNAGNK